VAIDIINFGEEAENTTKLEAFISEVNNNDNSHLVTVPPGPHILSDFIISSPIITGEDGVAGYAPSGSGFEFVDPNMEPELALALKISLEEEQARQRAENEKAAADNANTEAEPSTMAVDSATGEQDPTDDMLAQALADERHTTDINMDADMTEEEQIARAIEMSMQGGSTQPSDDYINLMQDPEVMSAMLESLPGVNTDDPRIQSALNRLTENKEGDEKKENDEEK